jgi:GNAT superfamily N-acetyltransferase
MAEQTEIRVGTVDDVHDIMSQLSNTYEEMGFSNISPVKVLQEVYASLSLDRGIFGIIGSPGETIQAGVLLRIGKPWYSDDDVVEERGIFVHPDYRSGRLGLARKLCDFSKKFAEDMGLPLIVGIQSTTKIAPKIRLYERAFGEQRGAFFVYNLKKEPLTRQEH